MDGAAGARGVRGQRRRPPGTCVVLEEMGRRPLPARSSRRRYRPRWRRGRWARRSSWPTWPPRAPPGTVALGEQGHGEPLHTVRTRPRRRAAQWVVTGEKPIRGRRGIPRTGSLWRPAVRRACAPTSSKSPEAELVPSLDPTCKLAWSRVDEHAGHPAGSLGQPDGPVAARVQDDIAIGLAAETVGAADRALTEAIAYTSERIVFDKPVATYQTVRHRLVEMFQQVEMAGPGSNSPPGPPTPRRRSASRPLPWHRATPPRPACGSRRRHPAPRGRRVHVGQRRPLPLQAGEAERSPGRRRRCAAPPPGLALHRVGVTTFELHPVPAELAERYLAEGAWDDRSWGSSCGLPPRGPDAAVRIWSPTNAYLGTVGEVYEESLRVAGGLRPLGLGPGDMVAFQLPNWVEAAITFYACSMIGVTLVPIVHFYGPRSSGSFCARAGPRRSSSCRASASATTWPTWPRCATGWRPGARRGRGRHRGRRCRARAL